MKPFAIMLAGAMGLGLATSASAQRGARAIALSPPNVRASATPLAVTLSWSPVAGAESYTVEQSTSANGPWYPLPLERPTFTQITAPSSGAPATTSSGGTLYYYRVSALAAVGEPGVTVVPRVTPPLSPPLGVSVRQEGADVWVSWAAVPDAVGYLVTAAPSPQSPPTHSVNAGTPGAEIRLVNVASPTTTASVWVGVTTRYGNGTALSLPTTVKVTLLPSQSCWPPASAPGPAPVASVTVLGPTKAQVSTNSIAFAGPTAFVRAERAPLGTQDWLTVGCGVAPFFDQNLAPGTAYQYRITETSPAGTAGQSLVTIATPPAPDSPTPTATLGSCVVGGCSVLLNWSHVSGAEGYRIETSIGFLYQNATASYGLFGSMAAGTPVSALFPFIPSGTHQFYLTPLFPPLRPGPQRPGLVTVVVP